MGAVYVDCPESLRDTWQQVLREEGIRCRRCEDTEPESVLPQIELSRGEMWCRVALNEYEQTGFALARRDSVRRGHQHSRRKRSDAPVHGRRTQMPCVCV